jgi:hypothetical protein
MVEKARAPGLKRQAALSPPILDIQLRGNSFVSANCGVDLADPLNYLSFKTHKFPQLASTAGGSPCGHDQIDLQMNQVRRKLRHRRLLLLGKSVL